MNKTQITRLLRIAWSSVGRIAERVVPTISTPGAWTGSCGSA
jgi:hypothetical protein